MTCVAFARLLCSFWCARSMFSVALGLMWVWVLQLVGAVGG